MGKISRKKGGGRFVVSEREKKMRLNDEENVPCPINVPY